MFLFVSFLYLLSNSEYSEIETQSKLPQNNPKDTEMTQGDSKYGKKALFVYFVPNFYYIQMSHVVPCKVFKPDKETPTTNLQFGL